MWFLSLAWNSGPALHPQQGLRGCMGVCPTSPHVFCGLGEGIRPCLVECLLRVKEEILPQLEEFKYLGVLFTSEGRMEQEIHRQTGP
ncbi:hypothetical protein D4764_01G0014960 [Takifugu flavidus]|uniref:Uncharacterized protein n=1 Tax=Takifugu flavidus TaxID=433684 RepID=A0A5C6PSG2_9TELE|nr:hypothetical protein D4764_01G0014960 [Takifugu flavidus]